MLNSKLYYSKLSETEYKRYGKQIILNSIGIEGQEKLKNSKILLVGAGGLGCPTLLYLASSGVGCLGIIDNDIVSLSNLQRQVLYTTNNINKLKTTCAKEKLTEINPECHVNVYSDKLTQKNAYKLINEYNIIIDASDNFQTRYLIDNTCYQLHKIHIYGAIQGFEGHISVFNYKGGPKYSDLYPKYLKLQETKCDSVGVLNVVPGIIGILQATEAIKIIIGIQNILSGYLLVYNSLNISLKKIKIKPTKTTQKKEQTLKPSRKTDLTNLSELKYIFDKNPKILLIDVRQTKEFNKNHILNAINIPLKNINVKQNIGRIQKLGKNATIIIYCSNNSRSIIASKILTKNNINHYRLNNGLHKYKK